MSSINNYDGKTSVESVLTTQESYEIEKYARNAVESNLKNLVMEVSSQALKKNRVYGITYDEAVFLNISEDHISNIEHPDFNDYFESKLKIFNQSKVACVNLNMDNIENLLKVLDYAKNSEKIIYNNFNLYSGIFNFLYYFYRKCYTFALILFIIELTIFYIWINVFNLNFIYLFLANFLFFIMFGNSIYLAISKIKIKRIIKKENYKDVLAYSGGTNLSAPFIFAIFIVIFYIICICIKA